MGDDKLEAFIKAHMRNWGEAMKHETGFSATRNQRRREEKRMRKLVERNA
jgi:hypothetical protein